ncbi:MAG: hypothetical protein LBQ77_02995 [Treponema sp.]|jgi:hypothetical protein|nr:hypothetical protein [Treponema sp.]
MLKKGFLVLLCVAVVGFMGCKDDEETSTPEQGILTISGTAPTGFTAVNAFVIEGGINAIVGNVETYLDTDIAKNTGSLLLAYAETLSNEGQPTASTPEKLGALQGGIQTALTPLLTVIGTVSNGKAELYSGNDPYTADTTGAAVGLLGDGSTYYGFGGVDFTNGNATVTWGEQTTPNSPGSTTVDTNSLKTWLGTNATPNKYVKFDDIIAYIIQVKLQAYSAANQS